MILIRIVLIFHSVNETGVAAQEQPSSIVTGTNMGWQHDAYRASGIWMPKWVPFAVWATVRIDFPCGTQMGPWWGPDGSNVPAPYGPLCTLANSAWAQRGPPISNQCPYEPPSWGPPVARMNCPRGAHMGPDGSMMGSIWVTRVSPEWAPCGPHGKFCVGPTWAAHKFP